MTTAQTRQVQIAEAEQDPILRAVQTVASAAAALAPVFRWTSMASLAAAVLVWGAWIAPFMSASIVSVFASLAALVLLGAPGLILLKAHRVLRDLPPLLERVTALKVVLPADFLARAREQVQEGSSKGFAARAWTTARAYGYTVLELRTTLLGAEDTLARIAGTAPLVRFIGSPAIFLLVAFALAASALLSIFGLAALIRLTVA